MERTAIQDSLQQTAKEAPPSESAEDLSDVVLLAGLAETEVEWACKWLTLESLATVVISDIDKAARYCVDSPPTVLVCPASLRCTDGRTLYAYIAEEVSYSNIACITIVSNDKETQGALDMNVTDVVRKPVNWNVFARRVALLTEFSIMRRELLDTKVRIHEEQRRALDAKQHLSQLEAADSLTKLPTAHRFRKLVAGAISQSTELLVFSIGIERFHLINDTHGREIGNRVLAKMGERLRSIVLDAGLYAKDAPSTLAACAAKLDGVRFALMVPHNGSDGHLRDVRKILTAELAKPIVLNEINIYLSTSIGAAVAPQHGRTAAELMYSADRAMTDVKRKGGGFGFHQQEGQISSERQLKLDAWLRNAIERKELQVAFQPLVNMWNNQIVGAEALLRWTREDGTVISPAEFIPVAEMNGSIVEIGDFVINESCAALRRWTDQTGTALRVAINLSITQLRRGNVVRTLERALVQYGLEPAQLEMEISERGDIGSDRRIIRQLHELKAIGVRLSLDDFGTGDTAIDYLKKLPIDILKLDRSYVSGALENGADAVITSALITLARNMNLTVIAEGIESKEQYELLRSWKCHLYQGYYCSPAIPSEDFLQLYNDTSKPVLQELHS
ncbi:MAG: putative bifunctional diguanylate cyclase/phosphodiesterase [Gammaproteobacteria bacterium]